MNNLAEQYIIDILKQEMSIPNNRIWIRQQNVVIPNDQDIFMAVGYVDGRIMSAVTETYMETVDGSEVMKERQRIREVENIQIDIQSRDTSAILRRKEVIASLRSIYAEQVQEKNAFKIFRIPTSFVNTSETEGAEKINKFSIIIVCHTWYNREKIISSSLGEWYDDFDTRVDDKKTIDDADGLIEFNIEGENIT